MHYICKDCNYEFDFFPQPHPHAGLKYYSPMGCPVCRKARSMSRICPMCGSLRLEQYLSSSPLFGDLSKQK